MLPSVTDVPLPEPTENDRTVYEVMREEGRANPYLIRLRTNLDKGAVNTALNRLLGTGAIVRVCRGLYEYQGEPTDE